MADVRQAELVNYAVATWIGSGAYQEGDRRMAIVRLPVSTTLRPIEADLGGLRLLLPVTFSFYDYSNSDVDFSTVRLHRDSR